MKALIRDSHLCTFRNFILAKIIQNTEDFKGIVRDANMITIAFLQNTGV